MNTYKLHLQNFELLENKLETSNFNQSFGQNQRFPLLRIIPYRKSYKHLVQPRNQNRDQHRSRIRYH